MSRFAKNFLFIVVIIGLLGGCSGVNKEDQEIIDRSEPIAIKYLKEKYDMDVVITKRQLLPRYVEPSVVFYGYVVGQEEQTFDITVDYEDTIAGSFGFSPELETALREKGFDPFKIE